MLAPTASATGTTLLRTPAPSTGFFLVLGWNHYRDLRFSVRCSQGAKMGSLNAKKEAPSTPDGSRMAIRGAKKAGGRGHMKNPMKNKIKILCVRPDEKPDEKPAENLNVLVKRADEKPG